jgi:SAM-dependent methyltransferase
MHMASGWIAFWDSKHSIYVNARHRDVHYRRIAEDIAGYVPGPDAVVLDYGCGEALHADRVAAAAGRLILGEAAPNVRSALAARFTGERKIEVRSPGEIAAMPETSIDLVIMNSVAQYLTGGELDALLAKFHRLIKPQGLLVIGDVVPPDVPAITDALALLRFAAANGFLGAALLGLVRTALSDYWRMRSTLGLARHGEMDMLARLAAAGFAASRSPRNIGHNPARMTFVARAR